METENPNQRKHRALDAIRGDKLIEVRFGVDSLRSIRASLFQVAYSMARSQGHSGYLVLVDPKISDGRLLEEWRAAKDVLRPEIVDRITICATHGGQRRGLPNEPDLNSWKILDEVIDEERAGTGAQRIGRPDFYAVVLQILLNRWLAKAEPITSDELANAAGCSYPTVHRAVQRLGSILDRTSDRRVSLSWFPSDEFARLVALSPQVRCTARFADRSGQPRTLDSLLSRLRKLGRGSLAVGGVLGARHYFPALDLIGAPRLDISIHCPAQEMDLGFISELDPALKIVGDPREPASVVVHAVRRKDSLFDPGEPGGLPWADPIECLLDLHEAGLEAQAREFMEHLVSSRSGRKDE